MRQHLNKSKIHRQTDRQTSHSQLALFRIGQIGTGQERSGQDRLWQVRTGQDRSGQVRTVQDRSGQDWFRSGLVQVTNGPGSDLDQDNLFENANVKFYLKTTCILFSTYTFQLGFISLRITKLYLRISKPHLEVF